jgi:hypothetical protein
MKGGEVVDLHRAVMQREKGAAPVVDEIIAERTARAVAPSNAGLAREVDHIDDRGHHDPALRNRGRRPPQAVGGQSKN